MRARLIRPPEASDKVDQLLAPRIVELGGADLRGTLSGSGVGRDEQKSNFAC